MKKSVLLFAICISICLSMTSCAFFSGIFGSENDESAQVSDTEPSVEPQPSDDAEISEEIEVSEEESVMEESSEEVSEEEIVLPEGAEFIGYSDNGFVIYVLEGVTYVDGVLIANKTYGLPKEYPVKDLTEETLAAFTEMQKAASDDGLFLFVKSGYRSYAVQKYLYDNYVIRDGKEGADRYSARPGHSEHQTGLAIDINKASSSFNGTTESIWIANNCAEFGFIIRYPEGKEEITGYKYESWHVRYVGKELAAELYLGDGKFMTLEEYYGITSFYQDDVTEESE